VNGKQKATKMKIKKYNSPFTIHNLLLFDKNLYIAENKLVTKTSPIFYE